MKSAPLPGEDRLGWLLEHGSPPVRFRVLRDIIRQPAGAPDLERARREVLAYGPAQWVAELQAADGTWNGRLHTGDSKAGVHLTTEIQLARLLEYGWGPGVPAVDRAIAALRPLLADAPLPVYRDLAAYMTGPRRTAYMRWFARSIAASLVARALAPEPPPALPDAEELVAAVGGVAEQLLDAAHRFVTGPAAANPLGRGGPASRGTDRRGPPVIRPEAYDPELGYAAIPDSYLLELFAFTPDLRRDSRRAAKVGEVLDYVLGPAYTALDETLGTVSVGEDHPFVKGWKFLVPRPAELARRKAWAHGLLTLEVLARLGGLGGRSETDGWLRWLEEAAGFPAAAYASSTRFLERVRMAPDWRDPVARVADVTFRVELIRRLV